ncbi:MAG: hypothetical protein Q7S88_00680 [Candidatus Daviesbacteria bacterium]|nr:hypothetical protein [Candidatus Daviesbacteria bacterium]
MDLDFDTLSEQLKKNYQEYRLIIWPVVITISSVVILIMVVIPQIFSYISSGEEIAGVITQVEALENKALQLQSINELQISQDLEVAYTVLPIEGDIPQSVVILQSIAAKSGLQVTGVHFNQGQLIDKINGEDLKSAKGSYNINLTVIGTPDQIKQFLTNLKLAPKIFQVDSISAVFKKSALSLEVEIPIMVFFESPPATIGNVSDPVPALTKKEEELLTVLSQVVPTYNQIIATTSAQVDVSSVPLGKIDPFN